MGLTHHGCWVTGIPKATEAIGVSVHACTHTHMNTYTRHFIATNYHPKHNLILAHRPDSCTDSESVFLQATNSSHSWSRCDSLKAAIIVNAHEVKPGSGPAGHLGQCQQE